MRDDAVGDMLIDQDLTLSASTIDAFAGAVATPVAGDTATLVPWFAAVVGGESTAVDGLGLDLSRALLAGIDYEWTRPFEAGETVHARVHVDNVFSKGANQFGVVAAEFTDSDGQVVHRQSVTFIERGVR